MTMNLHTQTTAPKASQATSVSPLEQSGSSKTKFSRGKSKARAGAVKTDLYQTVTDSIIAALESGVKPWVCPWVRNGAAAGLPANFSTGTAYSGINIMLLWCSAAKQGFQDERWLTYKQAQELGGQVRKGEHGTTAIFYKTLEKEDEDGEIEKIPMLKAFTVFNVEQIDGLSIEADFALIDGNRDHGTKYAVSTPHRTVVGGDGVSMSIAAASILAKVSRDRFVTDVLDKQYPQYQFARHKGYGTKLHYAMLDEQKRAA